MDNEMDEPAKQSKSESTDDTANALKELNALAETAESNAPSSDNGAKVNGNAKQETSTDDSQHQSSASSDIPSNFQFHSKGDGYEYYTDPEGRCYARDEANYWYYQDADGQFQPWGDQTGSSATADGNGNAVADQPADSAGPTSELINTTSTSATGDSSQLAQNQDASMNADTSVSSDMAMDTTEDDAFKSIIPFGADGRPQYPRRSDGNPVLPVGPDGKKVRTYAVSVCYPLHTFCSFF